MFFFNGHPYGTGANHQTLGPDEDIMFRELGWRYTGTFRIVEHVAGNGVNLNYWSAYANPEDYRMFAFNVFEENGDPVVKIHDDPDDQGDDPPAVR